MKYELVNNFLLKNDGITLEDKIIKELNSKGRFVIEFKDESTLSIQIGKGPSAPFRHISVSTTLVVEDEGSKFHRCFVHERFQIINISKAVDCFLELLNSEDRTKRPKIKSQTLVEIQVKDERNLFNLSSPFMYIELMLKKFLTEIYNEEFYEIHKDSKLLLHNIDYSIKQYIKNNFPNIPYNRLMLLIILSYIQSDLQSDKKDVKEHTNHVVDIYNKYCSVIYKIECKVLEEEFNVII